MYTNHCLYYLQSLCGHDFGDCGKLHLSAEKRTRDCTCRGQTHGSVRSNLCFWPSQHSLHLIVLRPVCTPDDIELLSQRFTLCWACSLRARIALHVFNSEAVESSTVTQDHSKPTQGTQGKFFGCMMTSYCSYPNELARIIYCALVANDTRM